ncbi:MAG TPA: 16S rRNA (cytidine(1402)-2'-O)-methyltransferase [Acidobacteria bacterium]|jgi:16S rRNA (cytidine1402-2'-O)-methyltransferase|nr:16S rRNA (cytidine(1402)-2'-O)-methyltransferase [Acidobacteriota bacterium]MDP6371381.1 16S rRNA (cytidine(1402)-2'-O)-methyltransferase [Vicinamibacterales bacterium]HAK56767.1 16S rRNA (cytidine(1402)-2'-O)-methyltransferase [Acidobacteriota bacterium]|tara:strand:- start:1225 stop:2058 length:834 start_codon:yes stop_codon:yes gene_type:complete
MPGTLYVVATPIGNLEDLTFRAARLLQEVELIAAEDTRRTATLLQHYSISTPTTSFHAHNEGRKQSTLLDKLSAGQSIALVSDAGTPTVSDLGTRLVAAALDRGLRVEAVPGASAVLAALSSSGVVSEQFLFVGFPPSRSQARARWLEKLADEPRPLVIFEAPHRIAKLLGHMTDIFGDRQVALGRELTKKHEELVKGPISFILNNLSAVKGEMTLVVEPSEQSENETRCPSNSLIYKEFCRLTDIEGFGRRDAISALARRHGISSKTIYQAIEDVK